jgi:hypothetical protein
VVAQTPSGAGDATLNNGFTHRALSIPYFVPTGGPTVGLASPDDSIEIFGTSLNNNMTLSLEGANTTGIACSSDGTGCYMFPPAHAA